MAVPEKRDPLRMLADGDFRPFRMRGQIDDRDGAAIAVGAGQELAVAGDVEQAVAVTGRATTVLNRTRHHTIPGHNVRFENIGMRSKKPAPAKAGRAVCRQKWARLFQDRGRISDDRLYARLVEFAFLKGVIGLNRLPFPQQHREIGVFGDFVDLRDRIRRRRWSAGHS